MPLPFHNLSLTSTSSHSHKIIVELELGLSPKSFVSHYRNGFLTRRPHFNADFIWLPEFQSTKSYLVPIWLTIVPVTTAFVLTDPKTMSLILHSKSRETPGRRNERLCDGGRTVVRAIILQSEDIKRRSSSSDLSKGFDRIGDVWPRRPSRVHELASNFFYEFFVSSWSAFLDAESYGRVPGQLAPKLIQSSWVTRPTWSRLLSFILSEEYTLAMIWANGMFLSPTSVSHPARGHRSATWSLIKSSNLCTLNKPTGL